MLDINKIEKNKQLYIENLAKRNKDYSNDINKIIDFNILRKKIILEVEELKSIKNKNSKLVGELIKNKKNEEANKIKIEVEKINEQIFVLDKDLNKIANDINNILVSIPNLLNDNIPLGFDDTQNKEVNTWGTNLIEHNQPHYEIATKLGLLDIEFGTKLSGSRFLTYTGKGAKIVRALADILINEHEKRNYKEINLPLIVNKEAMFSTGQLPKFEDDAYKVGDQYLIPTSEVPLTNFAANEIIEEKKLPIYLTAFTQCFRKEAGSAGRDTKGMIRLHQFNKVEMVKFTTPENSMNELELMLKDAENILKIFNLPYRVVELCSGDIGFSSTKTYDLEVWFPEQKKYREISSCSNCGDFQARRMNARFKTNEGKNDFLHTLNGSGVAIDRLFAAILENYWDGEKLNIPTLLKPYLGNIDYIK